MDLNPLKIERKARPAALPRRRRSAPIGWLVTLGLAACAIWVFWKPIAGFVDRYRLPTVKVARVTKTSALAAAAVSGVSANGYVVASKRAALSADTPGRIVELNVTEGSIVKKGDVVARLYDAEYRAELGRAQAELAAAASSILRAQAQRDAELANGPRLAASVRQAEADLEEQDAAVKLAELKLSRAERMLADRVWNQQVVDDARTELERTTAARKSASAGLEAAHATLEQSAKQVLALAAAVSEAEQRVPVLEAERDRAQATLDKTEVRAPFDGIVVLKDAEVGEVVSPNSQGGNSRGSVATMVDWSSLEVEVELPETSLTAARVGERANIFLDAYPERAYAGTVQRIWPTANRQKATVEVRVGFDAPDDKLRPEMGARVVFSPEAQATATDAGPAEPLILILQDAVVRVDGQDGVFVLERDVVRFAATELGEVRSDRVLVKSGLVGGETIVQDPPPSLAAGDRVRTQE